MPSHCAVITLQLHVPADHGGGGCKAGGGARQARGQAPVGAAQGMRGQGARGGCAGRGPGSGGGCGGGMQSQVLHARYSFLCSSHDASMLSLDPIHTTCVMFLQNNLSPGSGWLSEAAGAAPRHVEQAIYQGGSNVLQSAALLRHLGQVRMRRLRELGYEKAAGYEQERTSTCECCITNHRFAPTL